MNSKYVYFFLFCPPVIHLIALEVFLNLVVFKSSDEKLSLKERIT